MPYYIWKRGGRIVAHAYSDELRPAPAIEVSDKEAKALGIYIPPPVDVEDASQESSPTEAEDTAAMLIDHEYRLTLMELGLSEGGET